MSTNLDLFKDNEKQFPSYNRHYVARFNIIYCTINKQENQNISTSLTFHLNSAKL